MLAVKSVWQYCVPTSQVLELLETFRKMVNESLRTGLANDVASLRKAFTPLLQPGSHVRFSQQLQAPVIRLSRRETRGSSVTCPGCGERLQSDKRMERKLWCGNCRMVMGRDKVAAINLARRGRVRLARSRPPISEAQGRAVEAVKGNPTPTVILRVDAAS